ncbi:lycopene cyclase family protein [Demequina sp. NBRC 110054]|uniref:lycopene cyclase family protein n=1 Tax=Demequina sp. NBRC 110054 TaxID=1570343 RepID=UPI000A00C9A3|nr:lycopene cyclase family protein [Demequina sp. NBRC 110054]
MDSRLLRADAAIVGVGAAGLSLLAHLGRAGWRGTVVVVDDGATPLAERNWAWWSTGEGLLDAHATVVHGRARVAGQDWTRDLDLAPYAYRTITGEDLRAFATAPGESVHAVEWVAGTATGMRRHREGVEVEARAPDGSRVLIRSPQVFDSVGLAVPGHAVAGPHLDFLGWGVWSDRDIFTRDLVTFMDFRTAQDRGVAFMHVLPTSARVALVERTVFASGGAEGEIDHEPHLLRYLDEVLGAPDAEWSVVQGGTIPLDVPARSVPGVAGLTLLGSPAGAVKASTGYAFARIQAHSARIAAAMVQDAARARDDARGADDATPAGGGEAPARGDGVDVRGPASSRWYARLDRALLTAVREDPDGARRVLEELLLRATPEQLLRFLDEDLPLRQQLSLGARLPYSVFPRAYGRTFAGRTRL